MKLTNSTPIAVGEEVDFDLSFVLNGTDTLVSEMPECYVPYVDDLGTVFFNAEFKVRKITGIETSLGDDFEFENGVAGLTYTP